MSGQKESLPAWLQLTEAGAVIKLRQAVTCNSVSVDTVRMRAPLVRDLRASAKVAGKDEEEREMQLFASLCEVHVNDLEGFRATDYQRLQTAYFRLVEVDGVDGGTNAAAGPTGGN